MSDISRQRRVKAVSRVLTPGRPRGCRAHSALSGKLEEPPTKQTDQGLRYGGPRGSLFLHLSGKSQVTPISSYDILALMSESLLSFCPLD